MNGDGSIKRASELVGKTGPHLSLMKSKNPTKFRLIRFLGRGNLSDGYIKYFKYVTKIQSRFHEIVHSFPTQNKCAVWMSEAGISSSSNAAYHTINWTFNDVTQIRLTLVKKMKLIIKEYNASSRDCTK